MTDIDTAKLREIASAATQGEWRYRPLRFVSMCDEIDRLRALLRRASEALDPFVDVLGEDEPIGDEVKVKTAWGPCVDYTLTVGDLRAACTVAREIEEAVGDA